MSNTIQVDESKVKEDLAKSARLFANSLIWALLIAFPLTGIVDFILLPQYSGLIFLLRIGVAVLSFFLFQFSQRRNLSLNFVLGTSYLLFHAVLGFELYLAEGDQEIFVYFQVIALILAYNAVALWPSILSIILYLVGIGLLGLFYSFELDSTFQGFLSGGGALLLLTVIIPLALPTARYSAARINARKTLQLRAVLLELKSRNVDLSKAKEALKRYETEGANRLRIGVHDLNNRISSLEYLFELLNLKFAEQKDLQLYISKMSEVITEIKVFTKRVLSPPDRDHGEDGVRLQMSNIELNSLLNSVVMDVEGEANEKSIVVNQVMPKDKVFILADPTYLTSSIRNLVRYAIKFSRVENQIIVSATVKDSKVYIEVTDLTRGVTQSTLDHLFSKLPDSYSEFDTKPAETEGIGLSVAKFFINKMGAGLDYESAIDKGLRFIIVFEIQPAENQD